MDTQTSDSINQYDPFLILRAGKLYLPQNGLDHLEAFREFWNRFIELRDECEDTVLSPVNIYCFSITRLREPKIKAQIDSLALEINVKSSTDYDFANTHDAKENLFIYRTGVSDRDLIGFVGFVPHLANLQRKMCYYITKLYVEKE